MEALAERLIEVEFGVPTLSTIYGEHLYELAGFKEALGAEFVEDLGAGRWGVGVRLEQERIPWLDAETAISTVLSSPLSTPTR